MVLGGRGFRLKSTKDAILQHYQQHKDNFDALYYKIALGINDITKVVYLDNGIRLLAKDDNNCTKYLFEIMDLPFLHTKLYLSFCTIPGASIKNYNLINNTSTVLQKLPCAADQATLEAKVNSINRHIEMYNSRWGWVDQVNSSMVGNFINKNAQNHPSCSKAERLRRQALGKTVPRYTRMTTNFNHFKDGLHFTPHWRRNTARNIVGIMQRELDSFTIEMFDKLTERKRRRSSQEDKVGFSIPCDAPNVKRRRR